jgi:hypothetical protein
VFPARFVIDASTSHFRAVFIRKFLWEAIL